MIHYIDDGVEYKIIIKPSNFHVHWREIEQLAILMGYSAMQFAYALGMPNTKVPLTTIERVIAYIDACNSTALANNFSKTLKHFVALYLTNETTEKDIRIAKRLDVLAAKLYPVGATTNSAAGVTNLEKMRPIFVVMEEVDLPLSIHCEDVGDGVDFFDRERVFIDRYLGSVVAAFPKLRIIFEHVSTREGVQFIEDASEFVAGTVTPQHLLLNRNQIMGYPSRFCFPVINHRYDQEAIIDAVIKKGNKKFFLGTDSATHPDFLKYKEGFSGGCFTEPYALALYAEAFEREDALDSHFERFASIAGPEFYKLPPVMETIKLKKESQVIANSLPIGHNMEATPLMAGETLQWQIDSTIQ